MGGSISIEPWRSGILLYHDDVDVDVATDMAISLYDNQDTVNAESRRGCIQAARELVLSDVDTREEVSRG